MVQGITEESHSQKDWAQINRDLFLRTNDGVRQRWEKYSQKGSEYFLNEQISALRKKKLTKAGMPTFNVNEITPVIEMMRYFVTANDPRWKGVGVEGSDIDIAHIHTTIAEYCWKLSKGRSVYAQVILDALIRGLGVMEVYVDADADNGKGEVLFKSNKPKHMFVDKQAIDILWDDAGFVLKKMDLGRTVLTDKLPKFKSIIKSASADATYRYVSLGDREDSQAVIDEDVQFDIITPYAKEEDILDYYECYRKFKVPYISVFLRMMPQPEILERIRKSVQVQMTEITKEAQVSMKEQIGKLRVLVDKPPEEGGIIEDRFKLEVEKLQRQVKQGLQKKNEDLMSDAVEKNTQVKQYIVSEKEWKETMDLPQIKSNLMDAVPFNATRINVTCSVGDKFLYQKPLKGLEHYPFVPFPYTFTGTPLSMGAVQPLMGKQDEINKAHQIMIHNANLASSLRWMFFEGSIDEDEWAEYSSSAGALLKVRQGQEMPVPVLPAQLNTAFYEIIRQGKEDIQYQSGIPSFLQGDIGSQHDTYRGMLANDEYGTRRIKSWMHNVIEPALERVGVIHKEMAQATYKANKIFRIVQPNASGEPEVVKTVEINKYKYNDYGKVIGKYFDYASARFDVYIVAGSTLPVNRWALVDEFFKWFQAGAIDDIAFIEQADIPNKERLIDRMSKLSQAMKQIEGLERDNEDVKGVVERLKHQIIQQDIKHASARETMRVEQGSKNIQSTQKVLQKDMQNEMKLARQEIKLAVKEIVGEFKLAMKAELLANKASQKSESKSK